MLASSETGGITGQLWNESDCSLLVGWCVHLSGPVSATVLTSDPQGMYDFSGLPAGTYTVCEDTQGWTADPFFSQACQTFNLTAGSWFASNDFVNIPPQ